MPENLPISCANGNYAGKSADKSLSGFKYTEADSSDEKQDRSGKDTGCKWQRSG